MIELLEAMAHRSPQAAFIVHDDTTCSFSAAHDLASRGATWLAAIGIEPGDKVVLAVSNRPMFIFFWFALLARGAIAVPIAHDSFGDHLTYVIDQSRAKAVLTEQSQRLRIDGELNGSKATIVSFSDESEFSSAMAQYSPATRLDVAAKDPAAILYTSGTTGHPKGVVIPCGSYAAAGATIARAIGITAEDRILIFLPLHHANPQMYGVMSALTTGCCIVLLPKFSASNLLAQARRYGATGFTYVGTVLSILAKNLSVAEATPLRWCVGGGAPEPVWRKLVDLWGLRIHELYGMTETGGITTINSQAHSRVGSVGLPRDDFDVRLLDDEDRPVPAGEGEIVVRPKMPWLMAEGYFEKPGEWAACTGNLWFHTGDLGRFDADGYLYFQGRKKELIRRAGEMISPATIELVANRHPDVIDCAAVPVPDEIVGEEIKLVIVSRGPIDLHELKAFLGAALPRHVVPRFVGFADAIPKTATEKIQRFKLIRTAPAFDLHDLPVKGDQ